MTKIKNLLLVMVIFTITVSNINCAFRRKINARSLKGQQVDTDQLRSNITIQLHSEGPNINSHREYTEIEPTGEELRVREKLREAIQLNKELFIQTTTLNLKNKIWRGRITLPLQFKEIIVRTLQLIQKINPILSLREIQTEQNNIFLAKWYIENYHSTRKRNKLFA